jgi:hypothetical protein
MAITSQIKDILNYFLNKVNLNIETLTAEKLEALRLKKIEKMGNFELPVFPIPDSFNSHQAEIIFESLISYQSRLDNFQQPLLNDVDYCYDNNYFTSPDAEVLYTIVRQFQPRNFIEIGCGNSTKITRQAIIDGQLNTKLTSIDPQPRTDIQHLPDQLYLQPVEELNNTDLFNSLQSGDILFIDSSHVLKTGNDVVFLYTNVIPKLPSGVIIHIHDIFLPYDYPRYWVMETTWNFNEQYLIQSILMLSNSFEVLWPGYYLQQTKKDFAAYFPNLKERNAQSLWIRRL